MPFTLAEAHARRSKGDKELGDLIEALLEEGSRTEGDHYGILLLTGPQDSATVVLPKPIQNDTVSAAGKKWRLDSRPALHVLGPPQEGCRLHEPALMACAAAAESDHPAAAVTARPAAGSLAHTGADVGLPAIGGVITVAVGVSLLFVGRRRAAE